MKFRAILNDDYDIEERGTDKFIFKRWHRTLILFTVIWAVINLLAVLYINSGKFIYFWDDATYWDISRRIAKGAISGGDGFWHNVYASVADRDYNFIAALPSAAIAFVFGESRLAYVLGIVNMYLLPSYILIYQLAKKLSKAPKVAFIITFFMFPVTAFLAFNGFVDIGAMLGCLVVFNLYYTNANEKCALWRYAVIGLLLCAVILWRRYFAFFSVAFITAMVADCALFKRNWLGLLITGCIAGGVMILGFRDFVFTRLLADYGNLYMGYKFSVWTDLKLITRYFGVFLILTLGVTSVIIAVKRGEKRHIFLWLGIIVTFIMFVSTQTHGQQHLLLYIPSLIVLTLITIRYIEKEWMFVGICALAALHSIFVYIPRQQPQNIQEIKNLSFIPTFSMLPRNRDDAEEILALKQKLDRTVYEGDNLGVLASSFVLNEDILKNVEASLGEKAQRGEYIVSLPQVDSRDRDLTPFYTVNYILAAFPAQTHLADGSQTVIEEAVRSFEVYADIAKAYVEVPECETVIDGMKIKLFHRVQEEKVMDIRDFESRLYKK